MASGVYGITIPADIDVNRDVDIFYAYHENRNSENVENVKFTKLPGQLLSKVYEDGTNEMVEGMYNIKLPLSYFNRKGFYTVYLKPKEIPAVIADVSNLTAFPDVRGIVLDSNVSSDLNSMLSANNSLVGYRIIYLDDSGNRMPYFRLITSNNKCEPIVQTSNYLSEKSYTYRYNESSTLSFLTVTPSSAPSFKSNAAPFIGKPTQRILLVNTKFEPVMLDIEMTEHDMDTLSYMLEGSQVRDLDHGLITTFDENNNIYHQSEHYTLKDSATGEPVYEVKKNKGDNIDFTQTLTDKL